MAGFSLSHAYLLDVVSPRCGLPFLSCVSEVADDADVLSRVLSFCGNAKLGSWRVFSSIPDW